LQGIGFDKLQLFHQSQVLIFCILSCWTP